MSGMVVAQRLTVAEFLELDTPRWALTSPALRGFALPLDELYGPRPPATG